MRVPLPGALGRGESDAVQYCNRSNQTVRPRMVMRRLSVWCVCRACRQHAMQCLARRFEGEVFAYVGQTAVRQLEPECFVLVQAQHGSSKGVRIIGQQHVAAIDELHAFGASWVATTGRPWLIAMFTLPLTPAP